MNEGAVAPALPASQSGWRWLWIIPAVIGLDQLVKAWVVHHFSVFERLHVLPVLDIILTYNTGAAWSFLADASGWQRWVFVALALAVSVTLIVWLRRLQAGTQAVLAVGLALIAGGALGNMIDRLLNGRVVDFVLAHWGQHYFPAFNVADSAITIGAGLVLIDAFLETRTKR
jgi:signal peptidase II